jgi:hypothetical protein
MSPRQKKARAQKARSRAGKSPVGTDISYGQLKLKCPHGHELGAILLTVGGSVYRLSHMLSNENPPEFALLPIGQKVHVTCSRCGPHTDYQASWSVVAEQLADERRDTQSEYRTLILGA